MNYTMFFRKRSTGFRLWIGVGCSNEDQVIEECEKFKKFHPGLECGYLVE
jgi:hypothetical protein